jgi:hypothetical protein
LTHAYLAHAWASAVPICVSKRTGQTRKGCHSVCLDWVAGALVVQPKYGVFGVARVAIWLTAALWRSPSGSLSANVRGSKRCLANGLRRRADVEPRAGLRRSPGVRPTRGVRDHETLRRNHPFSYLDFLPPLRLAPRAHRVGSHSRGVNRWTRYSKQRKIRVA